MATLDTRPDVVDISHYGGDTLTVRVLAPFALVNGKEWHSQIRSSTSAASIDAEFVITPPAADGDYAYLVLSSAECSRLVGTGTTVRSVRAGVALMVIQYAGVWDVQVSGPGGTDPVTTLAKGALTIEVDVTRGV